MRWQRAAQAVIALLVIGFIALLVMTLRKERTVLPPEAPPQRLDPKSTLESQGGGFNSFTDPSGRERWRIDFGTHVALPDGQSRFSKPVKVTINRGEQPLVITADEVDVTHKAETAERAVFKGDVRFTRAGGLEVKTPEATYTEADGMVVMPGPVEFTKGRMQGSGVGATYDQNREVLWILDQARITVAADKGGQGALNAVSTKAGLARAEHYMVLEGSARIEGDGRLLQADLITIRLTADDERIQMLELRGQSRITGGQGGPQAMTARDIDLTYGDDGRTLQFAKLVENAVLQLPGAGSGAGKRVAAQTIDLALGPDGSTVTGLNATQQVQVDLPAENGGPLQRVSAQALTAAGAPGTGLQSATFTGAVEYRETPARIGMRALGGKRCSEPMRANERAACSETLVLETKPGLGALQKADFRGNVKFLDGPDFSGQAQQGIYHIAGDRLELMPAEGQPGPASPRVTDGKVSVAARTIQFTLSTREMTADTAVRSTILPQKGKAAAGSAARIPSMLAQEQEVNVTSNRLQYKGTAATYSGDVRLWQDKTTIKGDTILIEEKTGNLTATGGVTTVFFFEDTDRKTAAKRVVESTGKARTFVYNDARRTATYTEAAQIDGPQGNVSGDRIVLFLKPGVNELERAEAFGVKGSVVVIEGPRIAKGDHLVYTAADDNYMMNGTPVEVIEEKKNGTCQSTVGAAATFSRTSDQANFQGTRIFPATGKTLDKCPAGLGR